MCCAWVGLSTNGSRLASNTTKSLPRPCIFVNFLRIFRRIRRTRDQGKMRWHVPVIWGRRQTISSAGGSRDSMPGTHPRGAVVKARERRESSTGSWAILPTRMRLQRFQPLILVLALVLGQAAALAHTSQHPITGDSQHLCTLCLLQHNLDHAPPVPAPLAVSLAQGADAPLPVLAAPASRNTTTHYPIRAPPVPV
jgi:hypothetical protein